MTDVFITGQEAVQTRTLTNTVHAHTLVIIPDISSVTTPGCGYGSGETFVQMMLQ